MKLVDTDETIVLVTGSGISAEERDRPLAYWLKQEIDRRGSGHPYRRAVVVGDVWFLENRIFHLNPTIAIGGPGANSLAADLVGRYWLGSFRPVPDRTLCRKKQAEAGIVWPGISSQETCYRI